MASDDIIQTSRIVSHLVVRSYALPTQIHTGVSTNYSLWKIELNCKYSILGPFKPTKNRALRAVICGFESCSCINLRRTFGKLRSQVRQPCPESFIWDRIGFQFE